MDARTLQYALRRIRGRNGARALLSPARGRCRALISLSQRRFCTLRVVPDCPKSGIARAVFAVFDVAGEPAQEARVAVDGDRDVVPAEAVAQRETRVEALARAQAAAFIVVMAALALVRVVEAHLHGSGTAVADAQLDLEVVGIVADVDVEIPGRRGNAAAEAAQKAVRPERGQVVVALVGARGVPGVG